MTGEPTTHTTPKERNGTMCTSYMYINYRLKSEVSIMLIDAPIIGSLIGSVVDMVISTILIIALILLLIVSMAKNTIICNAVLIYM